MGNILSQVADLPLGFPWFHRGFQISCCRRFLPKAHRQVQLQSRGPIIAFPAMSLASRFQSRLARRFLGQIEIWDYARSGDGASMCRGLGQYVKKGYGGSPTAARRMGGTAQTAQSLYSALSERIGKPVCCPRQSARPRADWRSIG